MFLNCMVVLFSRIYQIKGISASSLAVFKSRLKKLPIVMQKQSYKWFLVLDFEATCEFKKIIAPQEIIEFPVLKVNGENFEVEEVFHEYVKPTHHPELSNFCIKLTGINQDMVSGANYFPRVLQEFDNWMKHEIKRDNFLFVTCGDWDLKTMLPNQCCTEGLNVPPYFTEWLNIKKVYAQIVGEYVKGMMPMIKGLNLTHVGRHHSGIDDCKNIANILKALAERGAKFSPTTKLNR